MSKAATDTATPAIACPSIASMAVSAHQVEEFQSAVRDELALFDVLQKSASDWMARRQVALETGLRALSMMSSSKTPIAAASICGDWLRGSVQRVNADVMEAFDFSAKAAAATQRLGQAVWTNDAGAAGDERAVPVPSAQAEAEDRMRAAA